jgi:hypothetical protein
MSVTDSFVISTWLKADVFAGATRAIVGKYGSAGNKSWLLFYNNAGKLYVVVSADGTNESTTDTGFTFAVDTWYHLVVSFSAGNPTSTIKVYANGVLVFSATNVAVTELFQSTADLKIGILGTEFFDGKFVQFKIFNAQPNDLAVFSKAEYELGRNTIGKTCLIQGNSAQVNSVSAIGDDVLISTGDGTYTGFVQTVSGGATVLTIEATTNASNIVLASQDYTVYSAVTASALHLIRPDIDFLKYVQNLVYKPKETIFVKGSWASAGTSITVTNPYITDNSNIIAMPQSAPEGSWYLSGQAVGTVTINSLSTEAYSVDYLLMINN